MKMQCFFSKTSQSWMLKLNGHTEGYFILNNEQKNQLKMSKTQDFMGKRNLFFWSLPISPWASFATWLHLDAPMENTEKINKYQLSNFELVLTHTVLELGVLGIGGMLSVPSITLCKKNKIKFKTYCSRAAQNPIDHNMVARNFKG